MTRRSLILSVCLWLLTLGLTIPGTAAGRSRTETGSPLKVQIASQPPKVTGGQRAWVSITLSLDPGWHIYGNPKGPGPGRPTTLEVISIPQGIRAEPARFLPAEKLTEPELDPSEWVWAYRGRTTIYVPLAVPANLAPGSYPIHLRLKAILCREGFCLPHQSDLELSLRVAGGPAPASAVPAAVLAEIQLTHAAETGAPALVPPSTLSPPAAAASKRAAQLREIPELSPRPLHRGLEVNSLVKAVLFALLAGFILNFTPCVLPVVSLKVLSFVHEAQGSRRRLFLIGLSFAAGIIAVFLVLAGLASFAGYGWGQLFQKQAFLLAMIALVLSMSLSLFGVFHLPIPRFAARAGSGAGGQGYWASFSNGTLATFLATPCSGPLLGGAMAWTLRQPPALIFVVFSCLGLGMASPYVFISLFPATIRWLPRPGAWLIHFERLMGFALLATVVYLLAIIQESERIWVVLFSLFLALGLYIWGQMTSLRDSFRRRLLVRSVALIVALLGGWLSLVALPSALHREAPAQVEAAHWQPYADQLLLAAAAENRWVVVDFTADWCPNCLFVEKTALQDPRVLRVFREHNALLLRADLTRENPAAKRLLERLGSRSIPFLALFPPGELFWQPIFLRDIYRAEDVVLAFSKGPAS
jgi:thiol:disulfide interchange protein